METVSTTQATGFRVVTSGDTGYMLDVSQKVFSSEGEARTESRRLMKESEASHDETETRLYAEHDSGDGMFYFPNWNDYHYVVTVAEYNANYALFEADQDIRRIANQAEQAQQKAEHDAYVKIHGEGYCPF